MIHGIIETDEGILAGWYDFCGNFARLKSSGRNVGANLLSAQSLEYNGYIKDVGIMTFERSHSDACYLSATYECIQLIYNCFIFSM